VRRGKAGRGQREAGKAMAGCRSGMWCTEGRRRAVKARHMAGEAAAGIGQSEGRTEQSRGAKGRRRD
jgi:hypothetical protein